MSSFHQDIEHLQISSIEEDMACKAKKGLCTV